MRRVFNAWGLPGVGKVQNEAALRHQRDRIPESSGVVENATPLKQRLLANREGATFMSSQKEA